MFELRQYQAEAIAKTYDRVAEGHRPIICAACGSGKTVISGQIAKDAMEKGESVLWMTGREEIIRQAYRTFSDMCGIDNVGVLCAGLANETPWWFYPKVTIASWDTLKARWHKSDTWKIPAQTVLVDECHLSLSKKMTETVIPHYADQTVIGFTATPSRKSGKGLGSYYSRIIQVRSVQQIIDEGYLAACEYWSGSHADTNAIAHDYKTGDFKAKELGAAHRDGKLIGDVIDNWVRLASDRHTIVFAVDIAHAQALTERFQSIGISTECIHSKLAHKTRERISEQFRSGHFQVLVNVGIAVYGYDVPEVNCVVVARPTKSIVLWHQFVGRGMRPKDGDHCVVLDHGDNVRRLGCIEDEIRWRLDEGTEAATNTTREGDPSRDKKPEAPPTECGNCQYIFSGTRVCPKCGWEKPVQARDVSTVDADLVQIRNAKSAKQDGYPKPEIFFRMLHWHARQHGYKTGWAAHQYKAKFGDWPERHWQGLPVMPATRKVASWIRSRQIAFIKSKKPKKFSGPLAVRKSSIHEHEPVPRVGGMRNRRN